MKKDLISIIVPVYNVVSYLPRCLDSIVNQTLLNSLFAREIEVKQNYIDALSIPNPKKFRQAFKELNSYFLNKGKTYIAAILGLDCLVKYVKGRKKNIRKN